jgi:GTP cyclohydrolase I
MDNPSSQNNNGSAPAAAPAVPRDDLPDTQNRHASGIQGARVPLQEVGSSNFRLPLRYALRDGSVHTLETSVLGAVSLEADRKGINMSRIIRSFYEYRHEVITLEVVHRILSHYLAELEAASARLRLAFSLPVMMPSLRSGLEGYQYYDCVIDARLNAEGIFAPMLQLGFVYSSVCPCSTDLSEHALATRGVAAIPHSQRSRARLRVVPAAGATLEWEDLVEACRHALQTETQAMVRRTDEQAFAERNAASQKFVEDAARLLYEALDGLAGVEAFAISCSHLESLHSHDAVATVTRGLPVGPWGGIDDYGELIC